MAQLKVLTPLTASQGASISNGLTVTGNTSVAAITASSVSSSGNSQVGGTFDVAGASTFSSVSASSTLQAGGAATLGSTLSVAGVSTLSNNLIVSGTTSLSGAVLFKSDTYVENVLSTGSLNDLTGTLNTIVNAIFNNAGISAQNAQNAYRAVRFANSTAFPAGGANEVYVWLAEDPAGASNWTNLAQSPSITGSTVQGLSGSTEDACLDQFGYAQIDVLTRASGSNQWTNDLVSVDVTAQITGSTYYPLITISAPGMGEGNGLHEFRLIVANDSAGAGGYAPQS